MEMILVSMFIRRSLIFGFRGLPHALAADSFMPVSRKERLGVE